jgi:hypothetical protein
LAKFAKTIKIIKVNDNFTTSRVNKMADYIWLLPAIVLTLIVIKIILTHDKEG